MADHGTQHHEGDNTGEIKSKTAFVSSFWFVIILIGLFIGALNFINVMGHSNEGHENQEATSSQTLKGETGLGREEDGHAAEHGSPAAADDTAAHEAQH
jgi:hypothetical protein